MAGIGAPEPGNAQRPGAERAHRIAHRCVPRRKDGAPRGAIPGDINAAVQRIDRRNHDAVLAFEDERGGEGRERRDAGNRNAPRNSDRARGRQAHPDAGERAWPDRHGDAVERGEASLRMRDYALDQRHERLGMAPHHGNRLRRDRLCGIQIEHAGRAGRQRSVDREDSHRALAFTHALWELWCAGSI